MRGPSLSTSRSHPRESLIKTASGQQREDDINTPCGVEEDGSVKDDNASSSQRRCWLPAGPEEVWEGRTARSGQVCASLPWSASGVNLSDEGVAVGGFCVPKTPTAVSTLSAVLASSNLWRGVVGTSYCHTRSVVGGRAAFFFPLKLCSLPSCNHRRILRAKASSSLFPSKRLRSLNHSSESDFVNLTDLSSESPTSSASRRI